MVQAPLAAVVGFEKSGIARPKDLEGRLVGVTGVPSDLAALDSIVRFDGGDPSKVRSVTIGFNAVQNVVSGAVDAAIGFWSAEGVQLASLAPAFTFRLDRYGAPTYPELVYFAKKDLVAKDPCAVRAFLDATARGYADTKADPDAALRALADGAEGLVLTDAKAQLEALTPVFQGDARAYGDVSMSALQAYLSWARQAGILDLTAAPSEFATDALGAAP